MAEEIQSTEELDVTTIVAEAIEPKLKEQFIIGIKAGWEACIVTIYEHCKSMTSAKKIKQYLSEKCIESKTRLGINE